MRTNGSAFDTDAHLPVAMGTCKPLRLAALHNTSNGHAATHRSYITGLPINTEGIREYITVYRDSILVFPIELTTRM